MILVILSLLPLTHQRKPQTQEMWHCHSHRSYLHLLHLRLVISLEQHHQTPSQRSPSSLPIPSSLPNWLPMTSVTLSLPPPSNRQLLLLYNHPPSHAPNR